MSLMRKPIHILGFLGALAVLHLPATWIEKDPFFAKNLEIRYEHSEQVKRALQQLQQRLFTHHRMNFIDNSYRWAQGSKLPILMNGARLAWMRACGFADGISTLQHQCSKPVTDPSEALEDLVRNLHQTERLDDILRLVAKGIKEIEALKDDDFEAGLQYEFLVEALRRDEPLGLGSEGRGPSESSAETVPRMLSWLNRTRLQLAVHQEDVTQLIRSYRALKA